MSNRTIVFDITALSHKYGGGVKSFSLDLCLSLIKLCKKDKNRIIIFATKNFNQISLENKYFKNAKWHFIDTNLMKIYLKVLSLVSFFSYLLNSPWLVEKFYIFAGYFFLRNIPLNSLIITPTSILNFKKKGIYHLLCIHDIQHEIFPSNFSKKDYFIRYWLYRKSSELSNFIQVSSYAIKSDLQKYFKIKDLDKIIYCPEGVNNKKFNYSVNAIKPKLDGIENKKFIFYPAQFWKHKNHINLIKGVHLYNSIHLKSQLSIVCCGTDFGTLKESKKIANELKVDLVYLGFISKEELIWCYRNSYVTASLSYYESSCLTLKEAIASDGNFILMSNILANKDLKDLSFVFSCDPFCPNDIFKKLEEMRLFNNSKFKKEGKIFIREYFWDKIVFDYYKNFIYKLIN